MTAFKVKEEIIQPAYVAFANRNPTSHDDKDLWWYNVNTKVMWIWEDEWKVH